MKLRDLKNALDNLTDAELDAPAMFYQSLPYAGETEYTGTIKHDPDELYDDAVGLMLIIP